MLYGRRCEIESGKVTSFPDENEMAKSKCSKKLFSVFTTILHFEFGNAFRKIGSIYYLLQFIT